MASTLDEELLTIFKHMAKDYSNMSIKDKDNPADEVFRNEDVFNQVTTNPQLRNHLNVFCFNYFIRKDYQKIKILLKKALKHQPDCLKFQFNLALAHYLSDEVNQALTIARKLDIKQLQKELDAILNFLDHQEQDFEDNELLKDDVDVNIDYPASIEESKRIFARNLLNQIQHLRETSRYTEAINKYHALFSIIGEVPCLLQELGQLYFWKNQHKEAKKYLNKALEGNPSLYQAYRILIAVHRTLKEYELAIGVLKKAVKAFPNDEMLYLELASGYQVLHHPHKAVESLKKALELDPDLISASIFDENLQAVFNQFNQKNV